MKILDLKGLNDFRWLSWSCLFLLLLCHLLLAPHLAATIAQVTRARADLEHRVVEVDALAADLAHNAAILHGIVAEREDLAGTRRLGRAARAEHRARVARILVLVAVVDLYGPDAHVRRLRTLYH
jgi:hypothetical protein